MWSETRGERGTHQNFELGSTAGPAQTWSCSKLEWHDFDTLF